MAPNDPSSFYASFLARSGNGTTRYLSIGTPIITTYPFTCACFFNVVNVTADMTLMSIGNSGALTFNQLVFSGTTTGDPLSVISYDGSNAGDADTTTSVIANRWNHGVGIFRSTNSRSVYLNKSGVATDTTLVTPTGLDNSGIGAQVSPGASQFLNGRIFWPVWWNVELPIEDIVALSAGTPPWEIRPNNIVSFPDLESLYDPYFGKVWTNNAATPVLAGPNLLLPAQEELQYLDVTAAPPVTGTSVPQMYMHYAKMRQRSAA